MSTESRWARRRWREIRDCDISTLTPSEVVDQIADLRRIEAIFERRSRISFRIATCFLGLAFAFVAIGAIA